MSNVNPDFWGGGSGMQIWKDSKNAFQEKQGRENFQIIPGFFY